MVGDPVSAAVSGNKRKVTEFCSRKKRRLTDDNAVVIAKMRSNSSLQNVEDSVGRTRPKRGALWSNCKKKSVKINGKSSIVETRRIRLVEDEEVAVGLTRLGSEDHPPCRKLLDFILHDAEGNPKLLEMSEIEDLFITAFIMPLDDNLEKAKGRGVKCVAFGRIDSWAISGYDEGSPVVWISTDIADYECVKPSSCYKCFYEHFYEKAQISIEVYRKLARSAGGNPDLSLAELVAAVVRSMNRSKSSCSEFIGRDFVICLGRFIYNQLIGLDETSERNDASFSTLPTLLALNNECRNRTDFNKSPSNASCGILKINEAQQSQIIEDDDQKCARLLQEWENWISMKQERARQSTTSRSLCTAEIASYYPLPAYYQPSAEEMDEYIIFENDANMCYPEPPRRVLHNWSLYDSDSRFVPLELLLMKPWDEVDLTVFGSGIVTYDDKYDDETGFCHGTEPGLSSPNSLRIEDTDGFPIFLSALKKWRIKKFEPSTFFISIQTDVARFWLGKPAKQYIQWYEPVFKTGKLVISIITLLRAQSRLSKLSFADVLKKVSEFDNNHPAFISHNLVLVESYVLAHGQFILQLFSKFPDKEIQKCAFVTCLSHKMQERHHFKPLREKKIVVRTEENLNASAAVRVLSKRDLMRATSTRLINEIWQEYYLHYFPNNSKHGDTQEVKKQDLKKKEENAEEGLEEKVPNKEEKLSKPCPSTQSCNPKSRHGEVLWKGEPTVKTGSGDAFYRQADVHGDQLVVGGAVVVGTDESEDNMTIVFLEYMFEKEGTKMAHGRILLKSSETILKNAGNEREVFLTSDCVDFKLGDVKESVTVEIRLRSWGHEHRASYSNADKIDMAKAEERKKNGLPMEYYCKSLYWPERGAFVSLPFDSMGLGNGVCNSCKQRDTQEVQFVVSSRTSFSYMKTEYKVHDFVYVRPHSFSMAKDKRKTVKGGRIVGLKPYIVCHLLGVEGAKRKGATPESTLVKVRRFYRPEDISADEAYAADIREVYYSEDIFSVSVEMLEGKCEVRKKNDLPTLDFPAITQHVFFCEKIYNAVNKCLNELPAKHKFIISLNRKASHTSLRMLKREENCDVEPDDCGRRKDLSKDGRLAALDIFSGSGGLSEGLHQSGVSFTKWAIEYEQSSGEAFSQNHPDTLVFIDNCNVILRAIMEKCGDVDDCISTSEATKLAAELSKEKLNNLPLPGQVDFIYGGPPCQGFSSMNRFNQGAWSKVQCEMILSFLSFVEYFRPRFFLLENVRTFVSFNKGHTFRFTLASLLEMGYQVRFGVLDAGSYGVAQSRKRAFIWAASPEEKLPEWPEPMHVVAGSELRIFLSNGKHYSAVRSTAGGAPFRALTVKDTIGDLPPVGNGASNVEIEYAGKPVSWFQKQIRGKSLVLKDHIAKSMNEINLRRCQLVPKHIGADWRELPDEKVELSNGQISDLRPPCLVRTAHRHNDWKGLFGRLGWEGNFPTSTTDPNPMHKVGMCFHPNQDRIVTVRECARSQGFPDTYTFVGTISDKHRQVGNAVPPTLAYALGRKLREAIDSKLGDC
ncbi:DNA (cytosine-5)-methyltransferase 1B-like isoform X1 [Dioscorea cayenensis subsp. rotundata]|uniref:DNA (cytosine-5)-methyltransferase n=1 Tax=Dioscorea cayennensis subsp. rotundata TaxID=55577 RepID=A0AB40CYG1_DIOCR|nr:DNA (cytosine-5)-methyltransferase 1B-like isoform X1 [Dioscorea cayenensis subsp. rotundata]XP_039145038.1 DNA (cytosine-5)-methyltransferase 1B-like isoform X1 [Dioscorea cayenensis subsp. rotundata]XP_039145039.1 DNA (cytosine-5)-methyltransferase 1B-like isoform X1 [Dioscorea cayenensis subsp. rotundata]XP_039145040.1 DNA (cytosine-5)-methyltransferase 1B-like isoform X1 [Dioscorea cayenensis subsp. rotundata]XP_039145041.1 DNA (cytosine-5)-methyltransferase 1B-like isoform X1 [Dioscorea